VLIKYREIIFCIKIKLIIESSNMDVHTCWSIYTFVLCEFGQSQNIFKLIWKQLWNKKEQKEKNEKKRELTCSRPRPMAEAQLLPSPAASFLVPAQLAAQQQAWPRAPSPPCARPSTPLGSPAGPAPRHPLLHLSVTRSPRLDSLTSGAHTSVTYLSFSSGRGRVGLSLSRWKPNPA